jgi:hypothetical protein
MGRKSLLRCYSGRAFYGMWRQASCFMEIIICNYPADLKWAPLWASGFSPFLSTLWQATTATKTAMVITALRRAQTRNRRRPEIILVGSAVVITRIILRSLLQPRGQTFRRLRHRPVRRRRARPSSLRLHLLQRHKRQQEAFTWSGGEQNFAAAPVFVPDVPSSLKLDRFNQSTFSYTQMRQTGGFAYVPAEASPRRATGDTLRKGIGRKADCDGPQFKEISINLWLTQLLPRLYTQKLVCVVALQAEI